MSVTDAGGQQMVPSEDLCLTFQALAPDAAEVFLLLVRIIVPHLQPRLAVAQVATALCLDSKLVTDLAWRTQVLDGIASLEREAMDRCGTGFAAASASERIALVRGQEDTLFFQALIHNVKYDFYNRHIVWSVLGYPDLGNQGGYLDRGFDVLNV